MPSTPLTMRGWLLLLGMWVALALILTAQHYLALSAAGRDPSWLSVFTRQAQIWGAWALLTPLVFAAAARVPLLPGRLLRGILTHLPIASAVIVLHTAIVGPLTFAIGLLPAYAMGTAPTAGGLFVSMLRSNFAVLLLVYALLVALQHVMTYGSVVHARETRASQLETQLARARLDVLQMQLQPHFLFNTLHAVSALMERDTAAARRMLTHLSDLLRASLAAPDTQEVTVEEEMAFLDRYIDIQRMRFHDRLVVDVEVEPAALRAMVPRLLMQPLVENAIRHGIGTRTGPGRIEVSVRRANGDLHLTVTDNGTGIPDGGLAAVRQGVGLSNTQARLAHLYGDRQLFELRNAEGGGTIASVRIPFQGCG
jgi:two-component system, LytTR family, sensor kinase